MLTLFENNLLNFLKLGREGLPGRAHSYNLRGHTVRSGEEAWGQELEASGHASALRKPTEMNAGDQPTFSFLCSLEPQSMEQDSHICGGTHLPENTHTGLPRGVPLSWLSIQSS